MSVICLKVLLVNCICAYSMQLGTYTSEDAKNDCWDLLTPVYAMAPLGLRKKNL